MSMHRFKLLYLCSTGRAGSTMTMRGLAAHPQICVRAVHPYETRFTQFIHASKAQELSQPDFGHAVAHGPIKYGPFQSKDEVASRWLNHFLTEPHVDLLAAATDSFYSAVAQAQGTDPAQMHWVAEKAIGHAIPVEKIRAGEAARALFLFRDPRDTYFSIKAFNRKVGSEGSFNERLGDEKMFATLVGHWRQFQRLKTELGESLHGARYEDLACGDLATWQQLFAWLGVDASDAVIEAVQHACAQRDSQVVRHSTTQSVDESIGRWENQATPADLAIFAKFPADLRAMGYSA
jgi:hypothetical protein